MALDVSSGLALISDATVAVLAVGLSVFGVLVAAFIYDSLTKTVQDDDQDALSGQGFVSAHETSGSDFAETLIDPGAFTVTCRSCLEESTASDWQEVEHDDEVYAVGDMDDEEYEAAGEARYECPICGAHQPFPE